MSTVSNTLQYNTDIVDEIDDSDDHYLSIVNVPTKGIGNGYMLKPTLTDLDLTHNQIYSISNLEPLTELKKLCLRQNLIEVIEGFHMNRKLESLDLYDNRIAEIPPSVLPEKGKDETDEKNEKSEKSDKETELAWKYGLNLPMLTNLDLSFNNIVHIENLDNVPNLKSLYFVQNSIRVIKGLSKVPKIETLELGANRIRKIDGLGNLPNLQNLWLGKNKITKIDGLSSLKSLRIISLQNNRITKIENMSSLVNLVELYLSFNGITTIENLENLTSLRILDLGNNRIANVKSEQLSAQKNTLEEFWINNNLIEAVDPLCQAVVGFAKLQTVYFEKNSFSNPYRKTVLKTLPQLSQIDADYVTDKEREEIKKDE